jgi:2-octaprenyl-6-methoxyphenol hydroxylase
MNQSLDVDVCIIGAGPVGGTLACLLQAEGVRAAVVDRAALPPMEHPDFDGRAYAIAAGPRGVLDRAGLWDRLPIAPGPITGIRVSDGKVGRPPSPLFLHFDSAEAGAGPFGYMVEARSLRMALNRRLAELEDVQVIAPAEAAVERSDSGALVRIKGGPEITCRLVVAAEGRRSPLREAEGIKTTTLPYGQHGIVCAIGHSLPHGGTALEHFLPGGPFAQLPLAAVPGAEHASAIVWTERSALAARLMQLDDASFLRELVRRMGDHLGEVRLLGRRWSYPLSALLVHQYTGTRLALAGDAAHGVHPIAGQGLNLGFRDIDALAKLVGTAVATGEDPGGPTLLRAYQAARRPDNMMMLAATDGLDRLFSNDNPLIRAARDIGIAAVHRSPRLKRWFMRQAMGALMA